MTIASHFLIEAVFCFANPSFLSALTGGVRERESESRFHVRQIRKIATRPTQGELSILRAHLKRGD